MTKSTGWPSCGARYFPATTPGLTNTNQMTKIKTQIKNITPAMAEKMLNEANTRTEKGEFLNRMISERRVRQLATAMNKGRWLVTHQGIALDTNGNLLDGQHRLWAVMRSGCTVPMAVTTGLPVGNRGNKTMDVLDIGKPRTVRTALHISHGYTHREAFVFAPATRYIASFVTKMAFTYTTQQCIDILGIYEPHIRAIMNHIANTQREGKMPIAILSFYHASNPEKASKFAESYYRGENLEAGDPAYAFAHYTANVKGRNTGAHTARAALVLAQCLYHHSLDQKMGQLKPSYAAMEWLIGLQPDNVAKIFDIISVMNFRIEKEYQ
jgi:hypothetical protein